MCLWLDWNYTDVDLFEFIHNSELSLLQTVHNKILQEYRKIKKVTSFLKCTIINPRISLRDNCTPLFCCYINKVYFFVLFKSNPNYHQEKSRCEYLHNKLAHIKKLISEYDQLQLSVEHSSRNWTAD